MKIKSLALIALLMPSLAIFAGEGAGNGSKAASVSKTSKKERKMNMQTPFSNKTFEHTWTEGAFAGSTFRNTYKADGSARLSCVAGPMKGTVAEQKHFDSRPLREKQWLVSWLEESGYAVSIVFDFESDKVSGLISNAKEYYPVSGTFKAVD